VVLTFNGTVRVAGSSPLVVFGFRRTGADIIVAYQYFYDAAGTNWDTRRPAPCKGTPATGTIIGTSPTSRATSFWTRPESLRYAAAKAFCLANTDTVDYRLPNANWQPDNTDLHTSCGTAASTSVREVLDIGSGDTYSQDLPGQSFDVSDLPNGIYYIEVAANADGRLFESATDNNTTLREVILGGEPGARTVTVPPYQDVDA